ncbi:MAG: gas vesicle protein GvpG [Candidatus Brocadiaceae bacterium]
MKSLQKGVFMFLIDDILLSPAKGLFYIFKQIHKAAEDDFMNEENITVQLSELYMMLETGKITEEEFDKKESELLDRLEQIEEYKKKHYGVKEENDENAIEADASNLAQNS